MVQVVLVLVFWVLVHDEEKIFLVQVRDVVRNVLVLVHEERHVLVQVHVDVVQIFLVQVRGELVYDTSSLLDVAQFLLLWRMQMLRTALQVRLGPKYA